MLVARRTCNNRRDAMQHLPVTALVPHWERGQMTSNDH